MPHFKILTEDPNGAPHFWTVTADSRDAAVAYVEEKEQAQVSFDATQLPAEDPDEFENRLAEVNARFDAHPSDDPKVALTGRDRAHYVIHRQTEKFEIVSVEEADLS